MQRGYQYGCLWLLAVVLVAPVAAIFGLAAAMGWVSLAAPIGGSVAMIVLAVVIQRNCVIAVNEDGVSWKIFSAESSIGWSNVGRVEKHRFGAKLVRSDSNRHITIAAMDPHWSTRAIGKCIQSHFE
jgi:hypothetical protein